MWKLNHSLTMQSAVQSAFAAMCPKRLTEAMPLRPSVSVGWHRHPIPSVTNLPMPRQREVDMGMRVQTTFDHPALRIKVATLTRQMARDTAGVPYRYPRAD